MSDIWIAIILLGWVSLVNSFLISTLWITKED